MIMSRTFFSRVLWIASLLSGTLLIFGGIVAGVAVTKPSVREAITRKLGLGGETGEASAAPDAKPTEPESQTRTETPTSVSSLRPLSSTEITQLIGQLRSQRQEYQKKLDGLAERERRVQQTQENLTQQARDIDNLKIEAEAALRKIETARRQLQNSYVLMSEVESRNLQRLAAVYESMDPAAAAKIVGGMDESAATKLLAVMSERKSGKVMEVMDPDRARALSEQMRLLKKESKPKGIAGAQG